MNKYRQFEALCALVIGVLAGPLPSAAAEKVYRVHEFQYISNCDANTGWCNDNHVKGNIDIAVNYPAQGNIQRYTDDWFEVYTTTQSDQALQKKADELTNLVKEQKKLIEDLRSVLLKRVDALPVEMTNEDNVYTALKARLQSDFDKVYATKTKP